MKSLALLLCWISGLIPLSHSVKCYSCAWNTEHGTQECLQEPPPKRFLIECSHPQCWKRLTVHKDTGKISTVQRFCLNVARYHQGAQYCQIHDALDNVTGEIVTRTMDCVCDFEACNGASGNLIGGVRNKSMYSLHGFIMVIRSSFMMAFGWRLLLA